MRQGPTIGFVATSVLVGVPYHYDAYVAPLMKPFIAALIAAVVRPGQRVLDVACGTGFATRAASSGARVRSAAQPGTLRP